MADERPSPESRTKLSLLLRTHRLVDTGTSPIRGPDIGFTSFRNYRIRTLLYAGKPNWDLLPTITPTSP